VDHDFSTALSSYRETPMKRPRVTMKETVVMIIKLARKTDRRLTTRKRAARSKKTNTVVAALDSGAGPRTSASKRVAIEEKNNRRKIK
jgi:hypothetical protein